MIKTVILFFLSAIFLYANDSFYYSNNNKVYLSPIYEQETNKKALSRVYDNVIYYKTQQNKIVGVSDKLIIKFKDLKNYDAIVQRYNLKMIKNLYSNVYLFRVEDKTKNLEVCNEIYKLPSVQYAHPNFIQKVQKR